MEESVIVTELEPRVAGDAEDADLAWLAGGLLLHGPGGEEVVERGKRQHRRAAALHGGEESHGAGRGREEGVLRGRPVGNARLGNRSLETAFRNAPTGRVGARPLEPLSRSASWPMGSRSAIWALSLSLHSPHPILFCLSMLDFFYIFVFRFYRNKFIYKKFTNICAYKCFRCL